MHLCTKGIAPSFMYLVSYVTGREGQGVPPFDEVAEVTLTADGEQTILVVEVRGMPLDKIFAYGAGWQIHAENLAAYLAEREPADVEARWTALVPPYQDLAANIG
jgi:hypothetical protein